MKNLLLVANGGPDELLPVETNEFDIQCNGGQIEAV